MKNQREQKQITIMNLNLQWKWSSSNYLQILEILNSLYFKLLYTDAFLMTNYKSKSEFSKLVAGKHVWVKNCWKISVWLTIEK